MRGLRRITSWGPSRLLRRLIDRHMPSLTLGRFYSNRVRACIRVLGYATQGGGTSREHEYDLQFGGWSHVFYQCSYSGYGLMRAWRPIRRLVDFMLTFRGTKSKAVVGNLCLAKGSAACIGKGCVRPFSSFLLLFFSSSSISLPHVGIPGAVRACAMCLMHECKVYSLLLLFS